jgi:hypothetical protein
MVIREHAGHSKGVKSIASAYDSGAINEDEQKISGKKPPESNQDVQEGIGGSVLGLSLKPNRNGKG